MTLMSFMQQKRSTILEKWIDRVVQTYSPDSTQFIGQQKDQFSNPLGHAISGSIESVYDQLLSSMDNERLLSALDGLVRIRSVQDFSPSQAVAFVFQLKRVIREELANEIQTDSLHEELSGIESRIDRIALLAFEKYMECREKLHDIRINEIKRRSIRLSAQANVMSDTPQHKGETYNDDF